MMFYRILFFLVAVFAIAGCNSKTRESTNSTINSEMITNDPHSFAKPNEAVVKHLDLNLTVDFEKKILSGSATLDVELKNNSTQIILDTRDLRIEKVVLDDGSEAKFTLGDEVKFLGRPLTVNLTPATKTLTIYYSTSPEAGALQWLTPAQTAGKKSPFLFTQSQAILARTWVPIQDSPGIRFTYSATVKVPTTLMALMSAENPQHKRIDGIYHFSMPQPIPAYLLALAVGDLDFHSFDNRTGVYAEPVTIDKAVYEFADLPKMVDAAEKLYGPYAWGQYDLIILPPSFPFGGMENPRLTFATPTILAGDRSLTSLVAHELAHSWSGNLVTNATWNDFWMNEGFTVYFENRIMEALYGRDFADMERILGQEGVKETIQEFGDTSADTKLKLELTGRDPDEGVSEIAYQKGCNLLMVIEREVGREKFDAFLKKYFAEHAFKTITTEEFLEYYKANLIKDDSAEAKHIDIEKWIYGPGFPDNHVRIVSAGFAEVDRQVAEWKNGTAPGKLNTKNFTTTEWLRFLNTLPDSLNQMQMKSLDETFHFTNTGNSEILFAWFEHVIPSKYEAAYSSMETFLTNVGRRKFVKPLYSALIKTAEGKEMAHKIYAKARPNYHSVTTHTIDEILGWEN
ncbi:MAG: M1 family metallopeptidase [Bacteroidota bacterium]